MKIDFPTPKQGMELVRLWQEAFGDSLEFIEGFFCTAYSPSRCRCVTVDRKVVAALYWLDARLDGRRYAYLYAVATAAAHRGKGLCRKLMEDTHAHLALRGYDGAVLVPQTPTLRQMYGNMGYESCTTVDEFSCEAAADPVELQRIGREEYARLRRDYLPRGGLLQEEENIAYLENMAFFYRGRDFLLSARTENGQLFSPELLGSTSAAPGILAALNCAAGTFRTPGGNIPFAMYRPLSKGAKAPEYFGLAFD